MKLGITCFTARGAALCRRLFHSLKGEGEDVRAWIPRPFLLPNWQEEGMEVREEGAAQWAKGMFAEKRGMIFVGAAGIAVRAIAPWLRDKMTDPPVVVMDEAGRFAIPVLSGHVGGANELACRLAAFTGAEPVITTATDVNQVFAVDKFAVEHGLVITDREEAKAISAALLAGEEVGYFDDLAAGEAGKGLPPGCVPYPRRHNIWITARANVSLKALRLIPRRLVLGVGCRRGTDPKALLGRIREIFHRENLDLAGVKAVATIDCKREEEAICRLAEVLDCELRFYSAGELGQVEGHFSESGFVQKTVGVGNVCERAACAGGGRLILGKQAGEGITAAIAAEDEAAAGD